MTKGQFRSSSSPQLGEWPAGQKTPDPSTADGPGGGSPDDTDAAAAAAFRASLDSGSPLSERKLAAMFGKTSRRWARNRMAEAHPVSETDVAHTAT